MDQLGLTLEAELTGTAHKYILNAMDQFSKQEAIVFAEWVFMEGYRKTVGNNSVWIGENMHGYSTDQLYTLYLQQKNNPMSKETVDSEYKVSFSFTTFDLRKRMATGRNGSIRILTSVPKEEIDPEEVKQLCINEVIRLKPKWNILMLDVKDISPVKEKRSKNERNQLKNNHNT